MKKKYFLLLLVFPIFSFSGLSQTFTNNTGQTYNLWNSFNVWATALSRTIPVSGLVTPLSAGGTVLKQVNLKLGDGTPVNLTSYSIRLTSPSGTVISILSPGNFIATTAKNVDIKYRDDNILTFPSASTQDPFDIGYYRTTNANAFSAVNGENPNGSWVLEIIEATSFEIAFVSVDLVFGPAIVVNDITTTTINDNCASPQCMGESSVVKATISSYTGNANDPNTISPYPGGCNWNGAHNNSAWFVFQPSGTTAKLTISGVQDQIQTLVVNEANACVSGSQTVPAGGCPIDGVNDTYTSPRYTPSAGSSSNEQFNLSGLIPGNNYFLVVDGNGGAISPLYIELSGGLVDICCPTVISGSTDVCAGSASSVYSQVGGASGGTWAVTPVAAGSIDVLGNFTPSSSLADVSANISYDDGSCVKTFSITVRAAPNAGTASILDATLCSGSSTTVSSTVVGGTWSTSDVLVATVNSSTGDVLAIGAGTATFTYTVLGVSPCADATSSVSVTITQAADAGTASVVDATLCSGSSTSVSSTISGGTWSTSDALVATVNSVTGDVLAIGAGSATITYTVLGVSPCVDATSSVSITVTQASDAGTASILDATLCSGSVTSVSSTLAGGTWTTSDALVATVNSTTGDVLAIGVGPATITYTVLGTAGCLGLDASSTVSVTVTQAADAGVASVLDAALCSGSSTTASSTVAGGTWSTSDALVATVNSVTGDVLAIGAGTATITYTVLGTAGCLGLDANSTVNVTVTQASDPGTASIVDATLCSGSSTTASSTVAGGSWTTSDALVATVNSTTGDVLAIGVGPATITYTVLGTAGCLGLDASSTVSVTVTQAADAGVASVLDAALCSGSSTTASSTVAGGTWSTSDALVATVNSVTGDVLAIGAGTATITYTVLGTAGCLGLDANSTVNVTVTQASDPGTASIVDATLCSGSSTTASSTVTGGTWSTSDALVATVNATTGDVLAIGAGAAVITYTVLGTSPCGDVTTSVNITVTQAADAGTTSVLDANLCSGSSTTASSTVTGGTWSTSDALVATVNATTGDVLAIGAGTATITYTVLGTAGCSGLDASSTVSITVTQAADAGTANVVSSTLCSGNSTSASSTVTGGTWTTSDATVATVNALTGDILAVGAGTATITYTVLGISPCGDATSTVAIVVKDTPIAPTGNLNQGFCKYTASTIADLTTLSGTNILWYDASISGILLSSGTVLTNGTHYYATQTVAGCESALSLDVFVYLDSIQLGLSSQTSSACGQQNGSAVVLATNGIGSYSYVWSNSYVGNINTNLGSGEYLVVVIDSLGCSDSLKVSINCDGIIPEIITPNGDGKNETWILNLDPKVSVQLYNRWGNIVYSALPYLDDWDGKANEGITVGNEYLPNGTYFFLIDYHDGNKPTSGYLELIRY